jgi:hypothetical protein
MQVEGARGLYRRDMRKFSNLTDAVQFLAGAVENGDHGDLAKACRENLPPEWVLDRLREQNAATPLIKLYAGRKFPKSAREFKLGGHDKEFGHIHIDFVRLGSRWEIQKIWMCR